jgi:hypothetical protein
VPALQAGQAFWIAGIQQLPAVPPVAFLPRHERAHCVTCESERNRQRDLCTITRHCAECTGVYLETEERAAHLSARSAKRTPVPTSLLHKDIRPGE